MAQLKIVYWRDIPGQVVIREGGRSTRLRLPPRFMRAIERAAYRLKKKQQDALFEPWHDVAQPVDGSDIRLQARQLVQQLETRYTEEALENLIRASGVDESRGQTV
ncbi:MAG: virulence factor [Gammaproteobacteria bacterium]|nr:virulence factor [Gammaproteobacteria bacterium]MDH3447086.1 virulence factor [Gammaproteobacteria bacterium]